MKKDGMQQVRSIYQDKTAHLDQFQDDFELSDGWKKEIDRRKEALKKGTSVGKPAREVLAKYIAQ